MVPSIIGCVPTPVMVSMAQGFLPPQDNAESQGTPANKYNKKGFACFHLLYFLWIYFFLSALCSFVFDGFPKYLEILCYLLC